MSAIEVACTATSNVLRYTCAVTVDPPQAVSISWARADGLGPLRVHTSDAVAPEHSLDVYFLTALQAYDVTAAAVAFPVEPLAETSFTTETPPAALGSALVMTGTSSLGLIGTETPCDTGAYAVIYDTSTGELVWYENLDPGGSLGMLDMVRFTDDMTVIGETNGSVVEVDVMGNDIARFDVSYGGCCGLNHDIHEANGLYHSQYQHIVGGLTLDNVVAIDASGVEQWEWDPADHLSIPGNASGDYLHTNSEHVDADGNFYLSWLNRDAIGKFHGDRMSPDWGEPIWLMTGNGQQGDLGNDITVDWSAVPGADSFGGQHCLHLRRDGRVMLLDNDHGRGLVLSVDDATLTATADAVYATHESQCFPQGTAMDAFNGNAVVACATGWVREYDEATSAMIWEAEIDCRNSGGGGFTPNAAVRWYPLDHWE